MLLTLKNLIQGIFVNCCKPPFQVHFVKIKDSIHQLLRNICSNFVVVWVSFGIRNTRDITNGILAFLYLKIPRNAFVSNLESESRICLVLPFLIFQNSVNQRKSPIQLQEALKDSIFISQSVRKYIYMYIYMYMIFFWIIHTR